MKEKGGISLLSYSLVAAMIRLTQRQRAQDVVFHFRPFFCLFWELLPDVMTPAPTESTDRGD